MIQTFSSSARRVLVQECDCVYVGGLNGLCFAQECPDNFKIGIFSINRCFSEDILIFTSVLNLPLTQALILKNHLSHLILFFSGLFPEQLNNNKLKMLLEVKLNGKKLAHLDKNWRSYASLEKSGRASSSKVGRG